MSEAVPYYADERVTLHHGDCLDVLCILADASVDAVVTDPPYELGFMGRKWDSSGIAYSVDLWGEALRVLKPGGHLLAFGGTRTVHRLTCAIEDAGFEIRDGIDWLYGSGFPKSLDVSKAIDRAAGAEREPGVPGPYASRRPRDEVAAVSAYADGVGDAASALITTPATDDAIRWQGWGTALKPAREPIVVARKPLIGTVAANVQAYGTGALNIDATRVGNEQRTNPAGSASSLQRVSRVEQGYRNALTASVGEASTVSGRWPSNVVISHAATPDGEDLCGDGCVDGCPVAELDGQCGTTVSRVGSPRGAGAGSGWGMTRTGAEYADSGGPSRFFPAFRYQAKAPSRERVSYVKPMLRLRANLTPEQVDHVMAQLRGIGVKVA